jgi:RNA polymerase sigma-70 factor, ECF subfamily
MAAYTIGKQFGPWAQAAGASVKTGKRRFEEEALPFLPDIYRAAMRVTRNPARAEDVTQEVFLRAWKSFSKFEAGTNCKAWLYKILFHVADHERRKWWRVRLFRADEEFLEEQMVAPVEVPDQLTDTEIVAAVDALPEAYRKAVLLVDVEEFAYKEAAEILGVPIGTVMSRLYRGRAALREGLEESARSYGIGGGR